MFEDDDNTDVPVRFTSPPPAVPAPVEHAAEVESQGKPCWTCLRCSSTHSTWSVVHVGGGHVWIVGLRSFMMLRRPFNSLPSMVFGFTCPMVVHQPHTLSPEFLFALPVDERQ